MGAGTWTSRVAGWGLVLWLCPVSAVGAQTTDTTGPQVGGAVMTAAALSGRTGDTVPAAQAVRRVRPIAQGVYETATLVQEAARRSPTVRTMLVALDQTDLIVYVELAPCVPNRSGCLTFLTARGGVRMLRISIDMRNIVDDQIKWLGHEMARALEVSQAPEVWDGASLAALFARIGRRVNANGSDYESAGAEEAGRLVKAELAVR